MIWTDAWELITDGVVYFAGNMHISLPLRMGEELVYRRVASFDAKGDVLSFCPDALVTLDPLENTQFTTLAAEARFAFNFRIDQVRHR